MKIENLDVSSLSGKHVLFVEDIIDTGLTMSRQDYLFIIPFLAAILTTVTASFM